MLCVDLSTHLAELYARRACLEAELEALDQRIEVAELFKSDLESPLPVSPGPVTSALRLPPPSGGARRTAASGRGPKSLHHSAVQALRADDLSPYQRAKSDLRSLALRYAELHGGEIEIRRLLPLAIRLGLCKAEYYKDGWSSVYRAVQRLPGLLPAGKGRFVVSPVTDDAGDAGVA